jgi:citrate lyase beta subunit
LANSVFLPPEAEVERAILILTTLEEAAAPGKGASSLDGYLIDATSARMAENVVKQNELIQSKSE